MSVNVVQRCLVVTYYPESVGLDYQHNNLTHDDPIYGFAVPSDQHRFRTNGYVDLDCRHEVNWREKVALFHQLNDRRHFEHSGSLICLLGIGNICRPGWVRLH